MGFWFSPGLRFLWNYFMCKPNDLKASDDLVGVLNVSDDTKKFVLAVRDKDSQSVLYILAAQNLSAQSALDAECLIKEVRPQAVIVQVSPSALSRIQSKESNQSSDFPTSCIDVLKGCFMKKIGKDEYEDLAGKWILQAIFGIGFYGHFLSAKSAAEETGSKFSVIEFSLGSSYQGGSKTFSNGISSLFSSSNQLVQTSMPSVLINSKGFYLSDSFQLQLAKTLLPVLSLTLSQSSSDTLVQGSKCGQVECKPREKYEAPLFTQSVYSLLSDLYNMFMDIPAMGRALYYAQNMLLDVFNGKGVDAQLLSEVHNFRIAVEGLRIALTSAARGASSSPRYKEIDVFELPPEEQSCVFLAQVLKDHAKKFKTTVAVVDASSLWGIRRHWNSFLPKELVDLAKQSVKHEGDCVTPTSNMREKKSLSEKPVVAIGAGATAILGASSLSKVLPASTFVKIFTYKAAAAAKLGLLNVQRNLVIPFAKVFTPKIFFPGFAGSKTSISAVKLRAVAHSVIASAERTSFQAMRTAFYEIMRRHGRPRGVAPWAVFLCSMTTCTGLLVHGDGFGCVAESAPMAPTIAAIGRGLHGLDAASRTARDRYSGKLHDMTKALTSHLNKLRFD